MTARSRTHHAINILGSFHDELYGPEGDKRFQVYYGGAGSGKSYSIAQHLVSLALEHDDLEFLCLRKTRPAVKRSCLKLIKDILKGVGLNENEHWYLNRTDLELTVGSSMFVFSGLDEPEKFKSVEFNQVWLEEATEFQATDFDYMNMRCRRPHPVVRGRLYLSYNPIDSTNWAVRRFVIGHDPDANVMHSTYRDNSFLSRHDVDVLKHLEQVDDNFYKVYCLGIPGVLKGLIYSNWSAQDSLTFPGRPPDSMGMDLGHTNPTCIIAMWRVEGRLYIRELLYRTGMSTGDLLAWMKANLEEQVPDDEDRPPRWSWRGVPLYTDPSRPEVIEDVFRAGWNCKPAINKVYDGIMYVRSFELLIDVESVDTMREMGIYKWAVDKEGNPLDIPVKWADHAPDTIRYAAYSDRPTLRDDSPVPDGMYGGYGGGDLRSVLGEDEGRYDPYWGNL